MTVLPEPEVPQAAYDETYYREMCAGYDIWTESDGERVHWQYPGYLDLIGDVSGRTLLDIGAGRGELIAQAAQRGATAIGIEYSDAAVMLAEQTLAAHGHPDGAQMHQADARELPVDDASVDVVTMLDVIEHLTVPEQADVLGEVRRVLRPGGRMLIHTLPNRRIYEATYRLQRLWRPGRRRRWPQNPRNDYERLMHVGELSARTLRSRLRAAGFSEISVRHGEMIYTGHVPDVAAHVLYHRLAAHRLTESFGRADLWAWAVRGS